mgnify:CR=1 FL=1
MIAHRAAAAALDLGALHDDEARAAGAGAATTGNAGGTHNLLVSPGNDDLATLLRRRRAELGAFHVMLPEPATVEMLMEKTSLYDFAGRHGFRVPATHLLHDRTGAEQAAAALRFPCILKPSCRSAAWARRRSSRAWPASCARMPAPSSPARRSTSMAACAR